MHVLRSLWIDIKPNIASELIGVELMRADEIVMYTRIRVYLPEV